MKEKLWYWQQCRTCVGVISLIPAPKTFPSEDTWVYLEPSEVAMIKDHRFCRALLPQY